MRMSSKRQKRHFLEDIPKLFFTLTILEIGSVAGAKLISERSKFGQVAEQQADALARLAS